MNVLLVDDNELNLKVATRILEKFNVDVEMVTNGRDFINRINSGNIYDVIFMDIMMPEMDGVETLNKLKRIENFNIKVVALTADAERGAEKKYLNCGFDGYIPKPIRIDEIKKYIK